MTNRTLILMIALSKAPISISALDIFKSDYCQKCSFDIHAWNLSKIYQREKKNIFDK